MFKKPEIIDPEAHKVALMMIQAVGDDGQLRQGWNIRCNVCGAFGCDWIPNARPWWGCLALCPTHKAEYQAEVDRHSEAMSRFTHVKFEQPTSADAAASMVMNSAWCKRHRVALAPTASEPGEKGVERGK